MISAFLLVLPLLTCAHGMDNLTVAFQWKHLDFQYPSEMIRQQSVMNLSFIPMNNVPLGLEVYGDRLFFTIPRWRKRGVVASLAYINLTDTMDSPKLHPYPNWAAHSRDIPEVYSSSRARADSCGRLWVMDTGLRGISSPVPESAINPRFVVYNLTTDEVIFSYNLPTEQYDGVNSFFANIAVEENDCKDSFAYLADLGRPALVVYDLAQNRSWLVKHHFFNLDPLAGNMNVSGIEFVLSEGVTGLALSGKDPDSYSTLYFHPTSSFNEFNVSTRVLRNESLATDGTANYDHFHVIGSRGPKAQSGASFLHHKSKVLFYALINLNAVACWRTTLSNYTIQSHGRVFMSNETMVFPSDIKVDANNTLWVLSNKLPAFLYGSLNDREYNFRVLRSPVSDAIRGTTCDTKMKIPKNDATGSRSGFVLLSIICVLVFL